MFKINRFDFNDNAPQVIGNLAYEDGTKVGENWPVVYVINNDDEAYIGETTSATNRTKQHLKNEERRRLTEIRIISDVEFNKSVILDLEAFLIKYMSADSKFVLQNGNDGLQNHNYYDRDRYEQEFKEIWNALREINVVSDTLEEIENTELFKYSPYKALMAEQKEAEYRILDVLGEARETAEGSTVLVQGGAGTGKTILAVYLMKLIADVREYDGDLDLDAEEFTEEDPEFISALENLEGYNKIGLVVPQGSLRASLKEVFSKVKSLDESMILTPFEVAENYFETGQPFDLLIVDEAHRLSYGRRGNLFSNKKFNDINAQFGYDREGFTQLDWILTCSKNQILFRDELQTVRASDIDGETFAQILEEKRGQDLIEAELETQWRCQGGNDYINFIKNIFSQIDQIPRAMENYDIKIYRDVDRMINDIKEKDAEYGLCRNVAGFAWPWDRSNIEEKTIEIQGNKYLWNRTQENWITTESSIDEIGCIHTVQGYDLNYAGVIIGNDIRYDRESRTIVSDKTNYYDSLGKAGVANDPELLKEFLLDIYLTLMTRGIKGTYLYICDDDLREYMEQFFEVV